MSQRLVPVVRHSFVLASLLLAVAARAGVTSVRITALEKDSARVAVTMDAPASVTISYGEAPGDWTGTAESGNPDVAHDIRLTHLAPGRQYFYQLSVDGQPTGDMLTFHAGRSWVLRDAKMLVVPAPTGEASADSALADRAFAREADVLVALGGDGGHADAFHSLHSRAMTDRLVLECGGSGDKDSPRLVQFSDVVIALLGDVDLSSGGALEWATSALPSAEGACWKVIATGRAIAADSAEAKALAAAAGKCEADLVLTRGADTAVGKLGAVTWMRVGGHGLGALAMKDGALSGSTWDDQGKTQDVPAVKRDCPIPKMAHAGHDKAAASSDDVGEAATSDASPDDLSEDCDAK